MGSFLNLNFDVLHLILDCCDRNTILQVMETCCFFNREGVQYLLDEIPAISTKAQASSFVQFALPSRQSADIAHRRNYIDSLQILSWEEEAQEVAQILKPFFILVAPLAPNLFHLEIEDAGSFFAGADAELSASVASLTTLEVLVFRNVREETVKVLRALQSRLIKAKVHYDVEFGPSAPEDMDPISCIRNSEDTLRSVSLRSTVSSPSAGCYRHVRALTLSYIDIPITYHFVHAFPNLRYLRASDCTARYTEVDHDLVAQRKRAVNVAEQAEKGSWDRLMSYKGSILMLYALGLACRVSHVYIHDDVEEGMDPSQIRAILGDTHPLHLTIRADGMGFILARSGDFIALCRSTQFLRLPSLRLDFRVWLGGPGWDSPDPEAIMNLIYDAIAPSPVTVVVLVIRFYGLVPEPPEPVIIALPPTSARAQAFLDNMDANAVADRLFTGNPSRGAVKVDIVNKRHVVFRGQQELIMDLDFDELFQ
uniref:Transcriptional repressor TUP1 n=1 Tax=Ganoderma boninense TaxID=34458 RepID=A0A5K1K7K5_9APHY|nr:Transcriptional repressor TUP1 [Ganoderma boninense]